MNQLAGVLSDLDLVRWPKGGRWWLLQENELEKLKEGGVAGQRYRPDRDPQEMGGGAGA